MSRIKTTCEFIAAASIKHNNSYSYENTVYVNAKTKAIVTCSKHGDFIQNTSDHLRGAGCPKCKSDKAACKWKDLHDTFLQLHGDYYSYDVSSFTRNSVKMRMVCPRHGEFWQKPELHKNGAGCKSCTASGGPGKYCETIFARNPMLKISPGYLYHIELNDTDGTKFFKIGITTSMKTRFYRFIEKNNGRICWIKEDSLYNCFLAEQQILIKHKQHQYVPNNLKVGGKNECFNNEILL